jgi:hypothetical protein
LILDDVQLRGSLKVHLVITDRWYDTFREAATKLSSAAGRQLEVRDCVYLLLDSFLP